MSTLSEELANDPNGLGYQTHITAGDHQSVAAIINEPRYATVHARWLCIERRRGDRVTYRRYRL